MFRRFLGTIFLYFYVIPAFSRAIRKIVIPAISKVANEQVRKNMKQQVKDQKDRQASMHRHPTHRRTASAQS